MRFAIGIVPASHIRHIASFAEELQDHLISASKVVVAGDLNIHHERWLQFSNANTAEGERLWSICQSCSLKQCVYEPTRNDYLLDL